MDYRTVKASRATAATLKAESQPAAEVSSSVKRRSRMHTTAEPVVYARKSSSADWQSILRDGAKSIDILGAAVDTTATEVAEAPLHLSVWDDEECNYVPVRKGAASEAAVDAYARLIRILRQKPTFLYRLAYALELVGEAWIIVSRTEPDEDGNGGGKLAGFNLAQTTALEFPPENDDEATSVKWHRYTDKKKTDVVEVDQGDVYRVFVPDPEHDLSAYSPYRTLCLTVEQLALAMDLVHSSLDELMVTAPILWMPLDDDDDGVFEAYKKENDKRKGARRANGTEARAIRSSRSPVAVSSAEKPEYIVVGSDPNEEIVRLIELMTTQIARASSQPTDVLLEGRGGANHWGALATARTHLTYTIGPRARVAAAAVTSALLTPFLPVEERGNYMVEASVDMLVNAQVNPADVRQAYLTGAIPLACVADSVGKPATDLNEWPEEERAHWEAVTGSQVIQADARLAMEGETGQARDVGADVAEGVSSVGDAPRLVASGGKVVDDMHLLRRKA